MHIPNVLPHTATIHLNALQRTAERRNTAATHYQGQLETFYFFASQCKKEQHSATLCNKLQHTTT